MTENEKSEVDPRQIDLFPPSQAHSRTSVEAAFGARHFGRTLRDEVLRVIREQDGATDEEVQSILRLNPSTQRPRRVELVDLGHVVDSGQTRKTKSGRSAVVWVAK